MSASEPKGRLLWGLLNFFGALSCLATVLGFAGRWGWVLDLFSTFRMHYLVTLVALCVAVLVGKKYRWAGLFAFCAMLNLLTVAPYYFPSPRSPSSEFSALRVVSLNVNTENDQYDLVAQFLRERHPDFVLLMELDVAWVHGLEDLKRDYPYQVVEPRGDNFGIALYSRHPLVHGEVAYLGESGVPSVIAVCELGGRRFTLLGTHPLPPLHRDTSLLRDAQLEVVAERLKAEKGAKMLLGDLNMTPWSSAFGKLLDKAGLRDSSLSRGIHPTWPTSRIWLGVPIDFCLVSEQIAIRDHGVGSAVGSDHLPIVVDFGFEPRG